MKLHACCQIEELDYAEDISDKILSNVGFALNGSFKICLIMFYSKI